MATAVTLLSRAATIHPAGSVDRLRLAPDLGFALFSRGRIADAEEMLASAESEADAADLPLLGLHVALERAMIRILSLGEHAMPRVIATDAIPRLEAEGDDLGLARAYLVIASAAWIEGHVAEASQARAEALRHAAAVGDTRTNRRTTCWGMECYGPAPAVAAITALEIDVERTRSDPVGRAQVLFTLAGLYAMRDRDADARSAYMTCRATMEDLGALLSAAATSEIGGVAELIIGDPDAAERWLAEGIARLDGLGAVGYQFTLEAIRSVAFARGGRFDSALEAAERAAAGGSMEDTLLVVTLEHGRSIALLGLGDVAGAIRSARAAVDLAERTDWISYHADALMALAEALRASGDGAGATDAAQRALDMFRAKEHLPGERRAREFLAV